MRIELDLSTSDLAHGLVDQLMIWRLNDIVRMCSKTCWHHPDDKRQDKKIIKACEVLLQYCGELEDDA